MIEVTYVNHMGNDMTVVNAARVSFAKESTWDDYNSETEQYVLKDKDRKLVHYLAEHKHTSPFGHCFASFHIKAPIFVARQLVKHKFLRWNEISRRYVDSEPEFYKPSEWRKRSDDKKQGSHGALIDGSKIWDSLVGQEARDTLLLYTGMIKQGVCPEQARMVLPQSTMTEWYWSGSLDAFADMCILRCKDDTQEETRQVADQISKMMEGLFPVSWDALLMEEGERND